MNKDQFSHKWQEIRGKIRERWSKLSHEDIAQINGNFDRFLGKLQHHYGFNREHAERELHNWNPMMGESRGPGREEFGHERREQQGEWRERGEERQGRPGEGNMWGEPSQKPQQQPPGHNKGQKKRKAG